MADKRHRRETIVPGIRRKKISPRNHFRAAIRLVIANLPWMMQGVDKGYNMKIHGMRKILKSNFTYEHKAIMSTHPKLRTEEEISQITKLIDVYKCFRKYPANIRVMLAGVMKFCYYGPDRVIVRKNHLAKGVYFIISGEVEVVEEKYDEFLDETERIVTKKLFSGDAFGEINLLLDVPRVETIISATPVEFLTLSREAFNSVLKGSVKEDWYFISTLLESLKYFRSWSKVDIMECSMQSVVKKFKKWDTVLGDGYGRMNYVYFVVRGTCELIEDLVIIQKMTDTGPRYSLYKVPTEAEGGRGSVQSYGSYHEEYKRALHENKHIHNLIHSHSGAGLKEKGELVFMNVCTFGQKACFSLGEPMYRRRIVAREDLTCLLVPHHLLIGQSNIWMCIKQYLTKSIPTTEVLFQELLKQRQWRQYKSELVKPFLTSYICNYICNVPYAIRIDRDYLFKSKTPLSSKFQLKQKQIRTGT